ncbi:ferredoxin domain-containing protein [uncultured Alistipes sp.]|uniref:ferredoxin domain-containing protein n=1 Tax=uncultured Alistipes sp. TaxID=538949 RepID=UPI002615EFE5|nr:DUF2148 domain-containing protein [uncultured Alistipes sp.]
MIIDERTSRSETVAAIARSIMTAGRTAPKSKGVDLIEIVTITGETVARLAEATRRAGEENGMQFFLRDADNILQAQAVILVGSRSSSMALDCGYCGFMSCAAKNGHPAVPCALNSVDLGIAIGSMTARAADLRVDCRVMYSVGAAARRIGLLEECRTVFAIPLSISSKNPFFDRQTHR